MRKYRLRKWTNGELWYDKIITNDLSIQTTVGLAIAIAEAMVPDEPLTMMLQNGNYELVLESDHYYTTDWNTSGWEKEMPQ